MPTTFTEQFFEINPYSPPPAGTALTVDVLDVIDEDDNDLISRNGDDSIDGSDITRAFQDDEVTIETDDGTQITYTGVTFYLADGRRFFTPTDGQVLQPGTLVDTGYDPSFPQGDIPRDDLGPPCFAAGTLIKTPDGVCAVEDLAVGDAVITRDNGAQVVRWINGSEMDAEELRLRPEYCPIRIPAGALGVNMPEQELVVSPQHRVLLASRAARRMFDTTEVLVAAKHLVGVNGIESFLPEEGVTYYHFMCDEHQVVISNGAPTESMYAGPMALAGLPADARRELLGLFPELATIVRGEGTSPHLPARRFLNGREGRKIAEVHNRHSRPLLEELARA